MCLIETGVQKKQITKHQRQRRVVSVVNDFFLCGVRCKPVLMRNRHRIYTWLGFASKRGL